MGKNSEVFEAKIVKHSFLNSELHLLWSNKRGSGQSHGFSDEG